MFSVFHHKVWCLLQVSGRQKYLLHCCHNGTIIWLTEFLCPWNSAGKNTGVDCHSLLQRNFPTQGLNSGVLNHRQVIYHLSYREVLIMTLSTIIIPYRVFFTALFLCSLVIYLSPPRNPPPPQTLIFLLSLQSFAFSRMTCTWKHTVCSLSDWLLSLRNTHLRFPMCC